MRGACFHVVVKMYRYSLEKRVFIVKTYWITGSIKNCQGMFVEEFGGKQAPRILLTTDWRRERQALDYLFVLPTSFLWIHKTHNSTSLQVWHVNVLQFCSFCKPTFSGATREWDALYAAKVYSSYITAAILELKRMGRPVRYIEFKFEETRLEVVDWI
jgi:hypothetical protein